MIDWIKPIYWNLLNRLHPANTVLSPHDELDAIAQCLGDTDRRIVMVDGGAHDGVVARKFARKLGDVEVHAFEPNTDLLPQLLDNLANVPGSINPLALAQRSGPLSLNVNASPMTSSILPRGAMSERYFNEVTRPLETRSIEAVSLDDFCARRGIEHIDVLKLDLQGYEAHALRGARRMLARGIAAVFTEISFGQIYQGGAQFGDIEAVMRQAGYELHNLYHLSTRNDDGRLIGGDALYVPRQATGQIQLRRAA
ncbi:MAG: FkbM family methyltransferase [Phycisphaeraceae bacterium]|nr:FkbM family methyltransferase [Phycisphaeraceae bacterium]